MPEPTIYEYPILDHGYIRLLRWLGDDEYLAETARVSTQSEGKGLGILNHLISHRHTSPIEFGVVQFEICAPLFVFREWHRHRTQSYSELSARYGELPMDFYVPTLDRMNPQSTGRNRQASDESTQLESAASALSGWRNLRDFVKDFLDGYRRDYPLARELSQRMYPQTRYTKCRASGNLWNWMHFLDLRTRDDAQYEIRQYANAAAELIKQLFPVAMEAYEEHIRYGINLSRTERNQLIEVLNRLAHSATPHTSKAVGEDLWKKLTAELL